MFDIGFSEMVLIGLIALMVLGPERLPKAARMVGAFLRKARLSWDNLRSEVEREIDADRFRKAVKDVPNPQELMEEHLNKPLREGSAELEQSIKRTEP